MKQNFTQKVLLLVAFVCIALSPAKAQLSGTITVPSTNYPDLATVVTALNAQGVGTGGLVVNITPGNPQSAPAGGYQLGSTTLNATLSAAKPLSIEGKGNTITSYTGTGSYDGVFILKGTDYVTIDSLNITEATANTTATTTMEWGYALLKLNATAPFDGCQHVNITNCAISLSTANTVSTGIFANHSTIAGTTLATTGITAGDANSYNLYSGNTIGSVTRGLYLTGINNTSYYDSSTTISNNTIAAGGSSNTSYGIYTIYFAIRSVTGNALSVAQGTHTGIFYLMYSGLGKGNNINTNNTFNLSCANTTNVGYGYYSSSGWADAAATFTFSNNTVTGANSAATTGAIYGFYNYFAYASVTNIENNNFNNIDWGNGTGAMYLLYQYYSGSATFNLNNNSIYKISKLGVGGTSYLMYAYNANATSGTMTVMNNKIKNVNTKYSIYCRYQYTGTSGQILIDKYNKLDSINSLSATTSYSMYLHYMYYGAAGSEVAYDTAVNITSGPMYIYNYFASNITGGNIHHNFHNNIATTTGYSYHYLGSSANNDSLHHNVFTNFSGTTGGPSCYLGNSATSSKYYQNTINNFTTTSGSISAYTGYFGNTCQYYQNAISGLSSTSGTIYNYVGYYDNNSNIYNNSYSNFSTGSGSIYGMYTYSYTGPVYIYGNTVNNLSITSSTSSSIYGAYLYGSTDINFYNNFITDISVPSTYNASNVYGIYCLSAITYKLYHNTVKLNFTNTGSSFGATGIYYINTATALDLRNNIINVNAPAGTSSTTVALRRSAGTAGTVPSNYSTTSSGNIYYVPTATNSYIYAEGTGTSVVNAYSATNDPNFNTPCGTYKSFMAPRESASFIENNLTATSVPFTYSPSGTSFAKSVGVAITSPAITVDYANAARPSANADAGALQFTGIGSDATPPVIGYTPIPTTTFCTNAPVLSAAISDVSGINTTTNAPRIYYRKKTETDAFGNYPSDNNSTFNGWKYVTTTSTATPFSFAIDYSKLTSAVVPGDTIQYFVVAQDNATTPNVGNNTVGYTSGYCPGTVNIAPAAGPTTAAPAKNFFTILAQPTTLPTVAPASSTICEGSGVALTATPVGGTVTATIGTGTVNNTAYSYPSPYGQYYTGARHQYLVLASELTAQGLSAGNISSVAFSVVTPNGVTTSATSSTYLGANYSNIAIKLGSTTATALTTTFVSTLTTVYSSASGYTPVTGWNTHSFSTPYYWDGVSNLVVDLSFLNIPSCPATIYNYSTNSVMNHTTTSFTSGIYTYADNNCGINTAATGTTTTTRANMRFVGNTALPINWTPVTGLYKDAALTIPMAATDTNTVVYAAPTTTTNYNVTNMFSGCNSAPSLVPAVVNVTPAPPATTTPTGTVQICPGTTQLLTGPNALNVSYQWKIGGVNITGATNNTYSATTAGTYTLLVTNLTTNCTKTSAPIIITNYTLPVASIAAVGATTVCGGSTVTLNNTGATTGVTYQWLQAGNNITGQTGTSYGVTATGSYSLKLTSTASGCSNISNVIPVTVNVTPTTITASGTTTFCTGSNVTLNAPAGTTYTYQWNNASGPITGATSAAYTTSASGNYTVLVTNTATNCAATTTPATTVTVGPAPSSAITPSGSTVGICQGGSTVLSTNNSPGLAIQWTLNGSTAPGNSTSATYTATTAGTYAVQVSSGPGCGSASSVTTVINPLPTATATATGSTTFCQGNSVSLGANTGTGLSYQWTLNGTNAPGASTNATYTATTAGNYLVNVSYTATGCATASATIPVTVNALPPATATAASATTICQFDSLQIVGNTGTNLAYLWKRNGVAALNLPNTNSSYKATDSGSYTVQVTNQTTGCSNTSNAVAVTVLPAPPATITPSGTVKVCTGSTIVLTSPAASNYVYQWKQAGVSINGAINSSYTTGTAGSYTILMTNSLTGCKATSAPTIVQIVPLPPAAISPSAPSTGCDSLSLVANSGAGYNYLWSYNGSQISGSTNMVYYAQNTGSYTVKVTDSNGCVKVSLPTAVTINPSPISTITYTSPLTFCLGGAVALNAYVLNGTGISYKWLKNGAYISGDSTTTTVASTSGSYAVMVTNSYGCSKVSSPVFVQVNPLPSPLIAVSWDTLHTVAPYISYQWFYNGQAIPGATNGYYKFDKNGGYYVSVVDNNGCTNISPVKIINNVGVGHTAKVSDIHIFPNPTTDFINIDAPVKVDASIKDVHGKTIMEVKDAKQVNLNNLANGIYMLTLTNADGLIIHMQKLIKMD